MLKSIKNLLPSKIKTDVVPIKHTSTQDPNIENEEKKKTTKNDKNGKNKDSKGNVMMFTNCNGIHIGNVKHINYINTSVRNNTANLNKPKDETKCQQFSPKFDIPEEIERNFENITMAEYSDFNLIKNFIYDWKKLGQTFCPGFDGSTFNSLAEEKIVLLILQKWSQANGRYATIGILCSDLWKIDEAKAAHKLAQSHFIKD